MLKKLVSYPKYVGPLAAYKGMTEANQEVKALVKQTPGLEEAQRSYTRYGLTLLLWLYIPTGGLAYSTGILLSYFFPGLGG